MAKWNWHIILVAIQTIYTINADEKNWYSNIVSIHQNVLITSEFHSTQLVSLCFIMLFFFIFLTHTHTHTHSFEMKILIVFYLCMCNSVLFWNKHVYLSFNLPTYTVHCISFKASSSLFFWYKGQTILQKVCNHTS